ncbi:MAG: hypothetical protein AAGL49_04045 [Pseudomonadota bacterium]
MISNVNPALLAVQAYASKLDGGTPASGRALRGSETAADVTQRSAAPVDRIELSPAAKSRESNPASGRSEREEEPSGSAASPGRREAPFAEAAPPPRPSAPGSTVNLVI